MSAKTVKKIKLDSSKKGKKEEQVSSTKSVATKKQSTNTTKRAVNPLAPIGRYIKGSWSEIRQVRWPSRRATWGMTLAVILFTLFFALVILLLDSAFQWLFKDFLLK